MMHSWPDKQAGQPLPWGQDTRINRTGQALSAWAPDTSHAFHPVGVARAPSKAYPAGMEERRRSSVEAKQLLGVGECGYISSKTPGTLHACEGHQGGSRAHRRRRRR
jgi:hypothetical protein